MYKVKSCMLIVHNFYKVVGIHIHAGGALEWQGGIMLIHGLTKSTLNTYFLDEMSLVYISEVVLFLWGEILSHHLFSQMHTTLYQEFNL